jgi:cyclohexanecarboxylate-CoA ligase
VRLRTTFRQPGAARYRQPGGAWDVPALDALLSSPRDATGLAVVDGDVSIDAGTLDRLVAAMAGGLRRSGVRRGDVVAWQLPNWWEALVLFRACWRSGAVAAPIHHQVGPNEVVRVLEDLGPALTLSTPGQPLAGLVDAIGVRSGDPRFDDLVTAPPLATGAARGSDMAVILFTSGSTGHPKAVLHTQRGLAYKARSMTRAHGLMATDVALMPSPLAHVSGLLNSILVPGAAAMTVVLMEKWDADRVGPRRYWW